MSYKDYMTNEEVCSRIQHAIGVHDDLMTMVKKPKLRCMVTSQDLLAWRKQFCRNSERSLNEEDRRKDEKKTSNNGQEWDL